MRKAPPDRTTWPKLMLLRRHCAYEPPARPLDPPRLRPLPLRSSSSAQAAQISTSCQVATPLAGCCRSHCVLSRTATCPTSSAGASVRLLPAVGTRPADSAVIGPASPGSHLWPPADTPESRIKMSASHRLTQCVPPLRPWGRAPATESCTTAPTCTRAACCRRRRRAPPRYSPSRRRCLARRPDGRAPPPTVP